MRGSKIINMSLKLIKKEVLSQLSSAEISQGEALFNNCECQILSQSASKVDFLIYQADEDEAIEYSLLLSYEQDKVSELSPTKNSKPIEWDGNAYACLLLYEWELSVLTPKERTEDKKYTREGMIHRVLNERAQKAQKASYRIKWADNIYGDHVLTNEHGVHYKIFLRDFESETGYSDSWDSRVNKLGTTKHIMYAFNEIKNNQKLYNKLDKNYPFVEVFCDPLNDYKITWFYPHELPSNVKTLISRHFQKKNYISNNISELKLFLDFITIAEEIESLCIRPEVKEKVEQAFEQSMLDELKQNYRPDYSEINAELFAYQKEGVEFALFKKVAIIADEMGLGKTIQAITTDVLKKQIFGFNKTLIICPATLKSQWKKEIEKFTDEKALIISGTPEEREVQYNDDKYAFFIVNYETILRDISAINKVGIDFLILDEAQRIKNYETKTASTVKRLLSKHTLIITGTPIENRLIDIFSVVSVLNPHFLGPLWEFSYQHCLFDSEKPNKINGYYNLQKLNKKLSEILIRREKRNVLSQLPNVQQFDIPIVLSYQQAEYHTSYARGIARILQKKFLTAFDMKKMQLLLSSMRMVCNSTYLIDGKTNVSPKLEELEIILFDKLDIKKTKQKIIIFSEWVKMHKLIGQMLRKNKVGFVELNGKVPVKSRGELIKKFEESTDCNIFLSTEAGGAGLNLQVADTLINFELPWNPAKKNQRIGRIDRLGQKSSHLTIYNLITQDSIEQQIAVGLMIKQNLFDGVLDTDSKTDYVDFSSKGRSQFIEQLEAFVKQSEERAVSQVEFTDSYEDDIETEEDFEQASLLSEDNYESKKITDVTSDEHTSDATSAGKEPASDESRSATELEQVMTNGMQFLAGLFKMSTGKDIGLENNQIIVDKDTGEVTMKFKLPKL